MKEYLKDNNKIVKGLTALAAMIIMAAAMTVITFCSAGGWIVRHSGFGRKLVLL